MRFSGSSRDCAQQHRAGVSKLAFDSVAKQRHRPASPDGKRQAFALRITTNAKAPKDKLLHSGFRNRLNVLPMLSNGGTTR